MNLSPDTLALETDDERRERENRTGVLGDGRHVLCHPFLEDPGVSRLQHRLICLLRPHEACQTCPHRLFTLVFNADRESRFQVVQCPRWEQGIVDRYANRDPSHYVPTELATCEKQPFEFCPSCPSQPRLVELGLDKARAGWYGRFNRLTKEEDDDG